MVLLLQIKFLVHNFKFSSVFQPSDPDACVERDLFLYRSYLAQRKFGVVKDEVGPGSPAQLQPLLALAKYLQSREGSPAREAVVAELETEMSGSVDPSNSSLLLAAATVFVHEGNMVRLLDISVSFVAHLLTFSPKCF